MNGQSRARRLGRATAIACIVSTVPAALSGCGSGTEEAAEHPGKAVYQRYCYACHQAGIADAPKLGDKDAWSMRLRKTRAELVDNVKRGMPPGMPPRAGCGMCTDEELTDAVDFMVSRAE